MLNAVGLQNPGIDAVIAEEVPNIAKIFHGPVIANIGGFSRGRSTLRTARKLNGVRARVADSGGQHLLPQRPLPAERTLAPIPKAAAEVTRAVKAVVRKSRCS